MSEEYQKLFMDLLDAYLKLLNDSMCQYGCYSEDSFNDEKSEWLEKFNSIKAQKTVIDKHIAENKKLRETLKAIHDDLTQARGFELEEIILDIIRTTEQLLKLE